MSSNCAPSGGPPSPANPATPVPANASSCPDARSTLKICQGLATNSWPEASTAGSPSPIGPRSMVVAAPLPGITLPPPATVVMIPVTASMRRTTLALASIARVTVAVHRRRVGTRNDALWPARVTGRGAGTAARESGYDAVAIDFADDAVERVAMYTWPPGSTATPWEPRVGRRTPARRRMIAEAEDAGAGEAADDAGRQVDPADRLASMSAM